MTAQSVKRFKKQASGYTLIEILVSLTIIAILFSFGYISFRDFARRQELAGVVRQIQGDLRLAQQMALSGQKPSSCGTNTLDSIRFGITTVAPYVYRVRAVCGSVVSDPLIEYYFPSDITPDLTNFQPNPIYFKVLGQGTNIGAPAVIKLNQTGNPTPATITITTGGQIK